MELEEYKRLCHLQHDNFYDYSLVKYNRIMDKVKIICPIHGLFEQRAFSHRIGVKCRLCGKAKSGKNRVKSHEQIIREFKTVHGNAYDYSKVIYTGILDNVTIIGITSLSKTKYRHNMHNNGYKVNYLHEIDGKLIDMYTLEQNLLNSFLLRKLYRPITPIKGGNNECFKANEKDIEDLINTMNSYRKINEDRTTN